MANRFRAATARLADRLAARVGDSVTYARNTGLPSPTSATVTVVTGRERDVLRQPEQSARFLEAGWDRDFLIKVAALTAAGFAEPIPGDRITIVEHGSNVDFEVFQPDGDRCWRYSDATREIYRIHCRQVT
jgi:hypothetical protein